MSFILHSSSNSLPDEPGSINRTNTYNQNELIKLLQGSLVELPTPRRIRYMWNFGSLLGLCLVTQILTGLFLAIHYCGDASLAFSRVRHICRDVNYGWILRIIHANGARFFFVCLYLHIGRGLYYGSYTFIHTWIVGVVILFIVMEILVILWIFIFISMNFYGYS